MKTDNEFRATIYPRRISHAYYGAKLEGMLRTLAWTYAPGLAISDVPAFNAWVEQQLEAHIQEAADFTTKMNTEVKKPVDTKHMV